MHKEAVDFGSIKLFQAKPYTHFRQHKMHLFLLLVLYDETIFVHHDVCVMVIRTSMQTTSKQMAHMKKKWSHLLCFWEWHHSKSYNQKL